MWNGERGKRLLTRKEISDIYCIGVRTLEAHSARGTGPNEVRGVAREVLYAECDVVAWLVEHGYPVDRAVIDSMGESSLRKLVREEVEAAVGPLLAKAIRVELRPLLAKALSASLAHSDLTQALAAVTGEDGR